MAVFQIGFGESTTIAAPAEVVTCAAAIDHGGGHVAGSPTLRRRRLSAALRAKRLERGMLVKDVAGRLEEWQQSKITRIENNEWKRPSVRDVEELLDIYEVTDPAERDWYLSLARQGRLKGWWSTYEAALDPQYSMYIGLEAEAASILGFEALAIHGLLQTEDHARALIHGGRAEISAAEVEKRVAVRMQRQTVLESTRLHLVMDEAVLHRQTGGPEVHRAQLRHLLDVTAAYPKLTLQVVPFSAGAHPGTSGSFTVLEFADPTDPAAAYLENLGGQQFLEEADQVAVFHLAFRRLMAVAASPADSLTMIRRLAEE